MLYQKIFVPLDDSEPSLLALQEAIKLAKLENGKIYIAYAVDFARSSWGPGAKIQTNNELQRLTEHVADKIFFRAREILNNAGVSHEEIVLETLGESVVTVLSKKAERLEVELIVIGVRAMSGLMHLLLGSVSDGVLKKSTVPIMMVRSVDI